MGRPKTEIKPKPAERLKMLCDDEGITQKDLSKKIHISPQTISKIINQRSSLTEDNAKRIIDLYPKYRFEWLMGYDPYKTTSELNLAILSQAQQEGDKLLLGLQAFASLCGYEISLPLSANGSKDAMEIVEAIKLGYAINRKGKTVYISIDNMNRLQNEICDFVEFKLKKIVEEVDNG